MVRVDRNVADRRPLSGAFGRGRVRSRRARPARRRRAALAALDDWRVALLAIALRRLPEFQQSLQPWRAAYDGGLIRPISKEEMADASGPADSQNLFDRWVTPRRCGGGHGGRLGPSTLILGSDGWRPIAKPPKDPKADAELEAAKKLFEQGKFAEAEKAFAKIAKDRKGTPWGETAQYYLAESQYQRGKYVDAHDNFEKLHADLSRHRLPRQAGQPRIRHRPALEPPRRSQRPQG